MALITLLNLFLAAASTEEQQTPNHNEKPPTRDEDTQTTEDFVKCITQTQGSDAFIAAWALNEGVEVTEFATYGLTCALFSDDVKATCMTHGAFAHCCPVDCRYEQVCAAAGYADTAAVPAESWATATTSCLETTYNGEAWWRVLFLFQWAPTWQRVKYNNCPKVRAGNWKRDEVDICCPTGAVEGTDGAKVGEALKTSYSCGNPPPPPPPAHECTSDAQCTAPQTCDATTKKCTTPQDHKCKTDEECPENEKCTDGTCRAANTPDDIGKKCAKDSECDQTKKEKCVDNKCKASKKCAKDSECDQTKKEKCVDNKCKASGASTVYGLTALVLLLFAA